MKKMTMPLLFLLLMMMNSCGGGDSSSNSHGITGVTINIGQTRTASSEGGKLIRESSTIPSNITSIKFTISAPQMTPIERVIFIEGRTSVSESFYVPNGVSRHFVVEAMNTAGVILYRGEIFADLDGRPVTLAIAMISTDMAPPHFAGLSHAGANTSTSLTLSWLPAEDNLTPQDRIQYLIYISTTPGGESFSAPDFAAGAGETSYTVTGLSPNTMYYFIVRAMDEAGNIDSNAVEKSAATLVLTTTTSTTLTTTTSTTTTSTTTTSTTTTSTTTTSTTIPTTAGNISGNVLDALSGKVVSGITINLRAGKDAKTGAIIATAVTQSDGSYGFAGLSAGDYTAEASGSGYVTTYANLICVNGVTSANQNITVTPTLSSGETRIVLTWGANPADLDSHLTGPAPDGSRFHIYFAATTYIYAGITFAGLDLDDTNGYGPETTTIHQQIAGIYRFSVHDFSNSGSVSSTALSNSNAQVMVYQGNSLAATFHVPANQEGTLWTVFELNGNTITPVNSMSYSSGGANIQSRSRNDAALMKNLPWKR